MLDIFNTPTPQGSNYQEFYGGGTFRDWLKPRGASMVRMLLIGGGAGGRAGTTVAGGAGGGSGAITEWIGPAIFIPDQLRVSIGAGGASSTAGGSTIVQFQSKSTTGYTLLTAAGAASNAAGTAASNTPFGASGIFKSTAGQTGGAGGGSTLAASSVTFLSGGSGGASTTASDGATLQCNYGYPTLAGGLGTLGGNGQDGFFLTQPIMIGVGGSGGGGGVEFGGIGGRGGIGCGGGGGGIGFTTGGLGGRGGDGAVFIWSW